MHDHGVYGSAWHRVASLGSRGSRGSRARSQSGGLGGLEGKAKTSAMKKVEYARGKLVVGTTRVCECLCCSSLCHCRTDSAILDVVAEWISMGLIHDQIIEPAIRISAARSCIPVPDSAQWPPRR
eukprot:COSAG02_NODE_493_length_21166_cov_13.181318_4_plen_125_part_00